jgi:hypothetical protein
MTKPLPIPLHEPSPATGASLDAILTHALTGAEITRADFQAMPAVAADDVAHQHLERGELYCLQDGDPQVFADVASAWARLPIRQPSVHLKLQTIDGRRLGLAIAHSFSEVGDAELVVCGTPGVFGRSAIRAVAQWLFWGLDLRRVTVRIRGGDVVARRYAQRLGFKPEGVQRNWFSDDDDAVLWGMCRTACRWLKGP